MVRKGARRFSQETHAHTKTKRHDGSEKVIPLCDLDFWRGQRQRHGLNSRGATPGIQQSGLQRGVPAQVEAQIKPHRRKTRK
jgi:hypothetical protein